MKQVVIFLLFPFFVVAYTGTSPGTLVTDGTPTDVQAAIDASQDGDIITIPDGSFTWTSGVAVTGKAVHIKGAGGGRVEGSSTSSHAISSSGIKAFTIVKGTDGSSEQLSSVVTGFTVGETVRAVYSARGTNYIEGTVYSYNGSTLEIQATSSGGSGTYAAWNFVVPAATTIIHNAGSATLFSLTEDTTASVVISDFSIKSGAGSGAFITFSQIASGKPIMWRDSRAINTAGNRIITSTAPRGLVFRVYWDTGFVFGDVENLPGYGLVVKDDADAAAWLTTSKMGTDDSDGLQNFYVEQSFFAGLLSEAFDSDGGSRLVVRRCVFDHSAITSHGADTGPIGQRHIQIYKNLWIFNNNLWSDTAPMSYFVYIRGGTGLMAYNHIPDGNTQEYSDTAEIKLTVQNLQRDGYNGFWGSGISGVQYPCPRQVGFGRITGTGNAMFPTEPYEDAITYTGDSEPFYQWGNAGGGNYAAPLIENYSTPTGGQDDVADYIQLGRDYKNEEKPGWTAYTYPHPLRGESASSGGVQVTNLSVGTFNVP